MDSDETTRPRLAMPEAVLEVVTSMLAIDTMNMVKKIKDMKNAANIMVKKINDMMNAANIMEGMTAMKETIVTVPIAEEVTLGFNSEAAFRESRKKE